MKLPHNLFEPGITPLCKALNERRGVKTLWSCQGHYGRPDKPFVIIETDQTTAFKMDQELTRAFEEGRLKFWWNMSACFQASGKMQYHIEPNDVRLEQNWRYIPVIRQHIDQELLRLADVLG